VLHEFVDAHREETLNAPITTEDLRTLNRCLDDAIAGAVTEYGRERTQSAIDGESSRGSERFGFFAHEMRNLINTSIVAFEVLKTGNVGVTGSTGTVLLRSLMASRALVSRSLAEVRLTHAIQNREQFLVAGFIEEIASASTLEANARGIRLTVMPVEEGVAIEAGLGPPSRSGSAPAPSAYTSRFRTSAAGSRVGMSKSSSAHSSNSAPIEPAWVLVSPSADGALKRTGAGSTPAISLIRDAYLRSTFPGSQCSRSRSFSLAKRHAAKRRATALQVGRNARFQRRRKARDWPRELFAVDGHHHLAEDRKRESCAGLAGPE